LKHKGLSGSIYIKSITSYQIKKYITIPDSSSLVRYNIGWFTMTKIKANKKSVIRWKVYIDRSRMYMGYIQFFMIGYLLVKDNKETKIGELLYSNLWISIPVLLILFTLFSLIIGRLDTVIGFREEELRNASVSNPIMREMQTSLDEIKAELVELKKLNYELSANQGRGKLKRKQIIKK
jgi:hypothetical protein